MFQGKKLGTKGVECKGYLDCSDSYGRAHFKEICDHTGLGQKKYATIARNSNNELVGEVVGCKKSEDLSQNRCSRNGLPCKC